MGVPNVSLSEQIGVLSIVEAMRHQQLVVSDHLDLPARKIEVLAKLKDYYKAKGIEVSQDLLDEGAKIYFEDRLTFEAPVWSKLNAWANDLYISRKRWTKPVLIGVSTVALVTGVSLTGVDMYHQADLASLQKTATGLATSKLATDAELETVMAKVKKLQESFKTNPYHAAEQIADQSDFILEKAKTTGQQLNQTFRATSQSISNQTNIDKDSLGQYLHSTKATLNQYAALVSEANTLVSICHQLVMAKSDLESLIAHEDTKRLMDVLPKLRVTAQTAKLALNQATTLTATAAISTVLDVKDQVLAGTHTLIAQNRIEELQAEFQTQLKSSSDLEVASELIAESKKTVRSGVPSEIEVAMRHLELFRNFAEKSLELRVTSGVERTANDSGGKSWFLIVEGHDAMKVPVPVPIVNSETGEKGIVTQHGLRVTQATFEKIKADKKEDGHIDDSLIGYKPKWTLTFTYNSGVVNPLNTITEW